jgi:hypothetical protein
MDFWVLARWSRKCGVGRGGLTQRDVDRGRLGSKWTATIGSRPSPDPAWTGSNFWSPAFELKLEMIFPRRALVLLARTMNRHDPLSVEVT